MGGTILSWLEHRTSFLASQDQFKGHCAALSYRPQWGLSIPAGRRACTGSVLSAPENEEAQKP